MMVDHAKTTKEFDIETILSLTTGYFICEDITRIHRLVEHLYGEVLYTLAVGAAQEEIGIYLCNHYSNINSLTERYLNWYNIQDWDGIQSIDERTQKVKEFINKLKCQYGNTIELTSMTEEEWNKLYTKVKEKTVKKQI